MRLTLLLFCLFYVAFIFPWAGMRHDDWLNLNTALHLPQDWSFLWRATWFVDEVETPWFFRPGFKALQLLVFEVFGFEYTGWLCVGLFSTVLGCVALARTIELLRPQRERKILFTSLFAICLPLHLGSLAWAGEGLINAPQVALLSGCTYFFCRGLLDQRPLFQKVSVLCLVLSLTFKESSIFHPLLLWGLMESEPRLLALPRKQRWLAIAPLVGIALVYGVIRIFGMPLNPAYLPQFGLGPVFRSTATLYGIVLLPAIAIAVATRRNPVPLRSMIYFVPFFVLSTLPLIGHPFFSPGWVLYPGMCLVFVVALNGPFVPRAMLPQTLLVAILIAVIPTFWKMSDLGWWKWHDAQDQFASLLRNLPDGVSELTIENCGNAEYPESNLSRVVASPEAIAAAVRIQRVSHGKPPLKVEVIPCASSGRMPASLPIVVWRFPEFQWLRLP